MMMSRNMKGLAIFGMGLLLFLYTMGIVQHSLDFIVIVGASLMMIYGFLEMDGWTKVKRLLGK